MATKEYVFTRDDIERFLSPDLESEEMKKDEEELLKDLDPEELFRIHKDDLDELDRSLKMLRKMRAEYDPGKHGRDFAEPYYLLVLDILCLIARRFHPLSEYGKEILAQAAGFRDDFEKVHGALVSSITKDNAEQFSEVLSADLVDEIKRGKTRGIAALRTEKDGTFAAGALCYYMENDPADNEPVLRVKWLYVGEDYRFTGVAGSLIGEMVYQMAKNEKISAMTLDYPALLPEAGILGELLQEWHFSFKTGLSPEFITTASNIKEIQKLEKYGSLVKSMESLKEKNIRVKGYSEGFFDREFSFFAGDIKNPEGLLLGHRYPSGTVRAEYIYLRPASEKTFLFLVSAFLLKIVNTCPKDTEIVIPIDAEEAGEVLDKLVPSQSTDLLVEAVLMRPSGDENMTGRALKLIIDSLDK